MSDTPSSAVVDSAPVALSSPAQRAAAGRSTALTPAAEVVVPVRRRKSSRRQRTAQVQRRQKRRHLRRLLWGGALALALLVGLAVVRMLPNQPPADGPSPWADAAGPAVPAAAVPVPTPAPKPMPMPVPVNPVVADLSAGQRPLGAPVATAPAAVAAPYGAAAAGGAGADGSGGAAQLRGAAISEADLGIRLAPGSQVDPSAGSRVRDPSGNETVMVVASSSDTADRLATHYRAQLQAGAGGAAVQSYTPGPGQLLLQTVNPTTGVNRAVLIAPQAPGAVTVTVVRAQPAPGP